MRFRGIPAATGHFVALNRALEHAFEIMDHCWCHSSTISETVDFTAPYTLAQVSVPKPPDGYAILAEGWCNIEWANTTALDCNVNIECGNRKLATSRLVTDATALAMSCASKAVIFSENEVTLRLIMRHNANRTSVTANTRGITARYIVKK